MAATEPMIVARQTGWKRAAAGIVMLTLLSLALLATTVWLFVGLNNSSEAAARSVREDAVWAAFQTDREAARLVEAALEATATGHPGELFRRFDLLYSRIGLLQSGKYGIAFGEGAGVGEKAVSVVHQVADLADRIDAMAAQPSAEDLTLVLDKARSIRLVTGELIVAANAAVNALRVGERESALATYMRIGFAVAGLTLVLLLIVGVLALQLRHISRTGREMERLSERYAKSALDADAANRAKSAFLATMSHEIRTPLNAIIGMADLIRSSGLSTEQSGQLAIIRQAGDVLLDVINDILDYSKLEAGAVTIEKASTSLPAIIASVEAIMAPRAAAAMLAFDIASPAIMVTADAARLRQILLNLVGNAIKFTRLGSVRVVGTLSAGTLRLEVIDTGPGIAPDQICNLFRDFSQLDSSSTRAFGGTGLGLAICKRLAEAMGGRIGVTSELGVGSTFWVELPVAPVSDLPAQLEPPSAGLPALSSPMRLILVVDDNDINRQVAGGLLRSLGMEVECASNGEEALLKMAARRFDLVLMDMQMPVLDGLEATRAARARGDRTPIVGLTANAFQSDRATCLAAGMTDHVAKPVTRQKLAELVAAHSAPPGAIETTAADDGIDAAQQLSLRDELGSELFDGLVAGFVPDAARLLAEARIAAASGDFARYDRALHTLKGAALTLGYSAIGNLADELRTASADFDVGLDRLETDLKRRFGNAGVVTSERHDEAERRLAS